MVPIRNFVLFSILSIFFSLSAYCGDDDEMSLAFKRGAKRPLQVQGSEEDASSPKRSKVSPQTATVHPSYLIESELFQILRECFYQQDGQKLTPATARRAGRGFDISESTLTNFLFIINTSNNLHVSPRVTERINALVTILKTNGVSFKEPGLEKNTFLKKHFREITQAWGVESISSITFSKYMMTITERLSVLGCDLSDWVNLEPNQHTGHVKSKQVLSSQTGGQHTGNFRKRTRSVQRNGSEVLQTRKIRKKKKGQSPNSPGISTQGAQRRPQHKLTDPPPMQTSQSTGTPMETSQSTDRAKKLTMRQKANTERLRREGRGVSTRVNGGSQSQSHSSTPVLGFKTCDTSETKYYNPKNTSEVRKWLASAYQYITGKAKVPCVIGRSANPSASIQRQRTVEACYYALRALQKEKFPKEESSEYLNEIKDLLQRAAEGGTPKIQEDVNRLLSWINSNKN